MLQFSRNTSSGRCVFADRCQFRLELSWRVVADYISSLVKRGVLVIVMPKEQAG